MPNKFRFSIDRGGTFTDIYVDIPDGENGYRPRVMKLLSEDPANYSDAPTEAIRRVLEQETGIPHPRGKPVDTSRIESIRMGTTVATNALLERKGERTALLVTKGFADLLHIGNQSRPQIFDLKIQVPDLLYEQVVEVDERVLLQKAPHAEDEASKVPHSDTAAIQGVTGEYLYVEKKPDVSALRDALQHLLSLGIRSIAIALMHAYTFHDHEIFVGKLAKEMGFTQISMSHEVMPMIKIVPRAFTSCADAYLTPKIVQYVKSFQAGFDDNIKNVEVAFMQSDGGLTPVQKFSGHKAILSGPAGGVVGYAQTTTDIMKDVIEALSEGWIREGSFLNRTHRKGSETSCARAQSPNVPVVGFDMGGTSTDVSRFAGSYEHVFETTTAGVTIQAPQLDINTVAAGGGSRLFFRSGMLVVGPESAGAHPGPVCYRKGGYLAVTDANLQLGRVNPDFFPKIFGPNEDEPLDAKATNAAFEDLAKDINDFRARTESEHSSSLITEQSADEVAYGFVKIANEAMCRPIRALTQMKGFDIATHTLACFGGAGGQHACAMARALGMRSVVVHRYSGILSAYGLALADLVKERQSPCHAQYAIPTSTTEKTLENNQPCKTKGIDTDLCVCDNIVQQSVAQLQHLANEAIQDMRDSSGFDVSRIGFECFLNLRYAGTDNAMMTRVISAEKTEYSAAALLKLQSDALLPELQQGVENCVHAFTDHYKREYGFTLRNRALELDDVRVRVIGHSNTSTGAQTVPVVTVDQSNGMAPKPVAVTSVYFDGGRQETPTYQLQHLQRGQCIRGPAILIEATSTIIVEPNCSAYILRGQDVFIVVEPATTAQSDVKSGLPQKSDLIQLSIFGHRFMSIAEQMGRTLQRTSISVNIKERLDFSCAIFGPDGGLVANAPHIPVHLGAMQEAVRFQISYWKDEKLNDPLVPGDVLVSNHPQLAGGSHLPDITVMTPVFHKNKIVFFVAARGHHADIGGIAPGSMPPLSKLLVEEGAAIVAYKLVRGGEFQEDGIADQLLAPGKQNIPGCDGCRNLRDVLSDLRAQVAANEQGVTLMRDLIAEHGLKTVHAYMGFIQENAEEAVRDMLYGFSKKNNLPSIGTVHASDKMDDGSVIKLAVTINREKRTAEFDFTGTGCEVFGNTNAPPAVTYSAIIYALRCQVGLDIPLNQGCLKPVSIHIPKGCMLNPSPEAAVVGGNVLTSQRVVDVILKAFGACAAAQGCMNNLTFGNDKMGYYETIAGGAGAGPDWHGRSGIHTHMTNTRITDPEIFEQRYPVILRQFSLRKQSGGEGKYNGGDGVIRSIAFRAPLVVSILSERRTIAPFGLDGGEPGACGLNLLTRKATGRVLNLGGKNTVCVKPGDELTIHTPGGGGYGAVTHDQITSSDISSLQNVSDKDEGSIYPPQREGGGSLATYKNTQESA